jgi:hypothetical protein
MSADAEILCRRLLDLALAQREALAGGNVDAALALLEQRQGLIEQLRSCGSRLAGERRVIDQILSADRDMLQGVREGMSEIVCKLDRIEKTRNFLKSAGWLGKTGRRGATV